MHYVCALGMPVNKKVCFREFGGVPWLEMDRNWNRSLSWRLSWLIQSYINHALSWLHEIMLFMNCLTAYTTTAADRKKIASAILSGFAYANYMQLPWLYGLMTINKYGAMSWPNRHASAMEMTTSRPQRPSLLI